jgi:hypothetical protein
LETSLFLASLTAAGAVGTTGFGARARLAFAVTAVVVVVVVVAEAAVDAADDAAVCSGGSCCGCSCGASWPLATDLPPKSCPLASFLPSVPFLW